jgi:hypothetical protein
LLLKMHVWISQCSTVCKQTEFRNIPEAWRLNV